MVIGPVGCPLGFLLAKLSVEDTGFGTNMLSWDCTAIFGEKIQFRILGVGF